MVKKIKNKIIKISAIATTTMLSYPLTANVMHAAGSLGAVEQKITSGASSLTQSLSKVAVGCGTAAIALAFLLAFLSRDDKEVSQNVKWIKRVLLCLVGIASASILANAAFTFLA